MGQTNGVGLVEIYDTNQAIDSDLANISTRGFVQVADEVMIGGFVLGGNNNATRIAVRALGPSLSSFGLANLLQDPTLELHNANGTIMMSNDNWMDDPVSAAQLTPTVWLCRMRWSRACLPTWRHPDSLRRSWPVRTAASVSPWSRFTISDSCQLRPVSAGRSDAAAATVHKAVGVYPHDERTAIPDTAALSS